MAAPVQPGLYATAVLEHLGGVPPAVWARAGGLPGCAGLPSSHCAKAQSFLFAKCRPARGGSARRGRGRRRTTRAYARDEEYARVEESETGHAAGATKPAARRAAFASSPQTHTGCDSRPAGLTGARPAGRGSKPGGPDHVNTWTPAFSCGN